MSAKLTMHRIFPTVKTNFMLCEQMSLLFKSSSSTISFLCLMCIMQAKAKTATQVELTDWWNLNIHYSRLLSFPYRTIANSTQQSLSWKLLTFTLLSLPAFP